MISEFSSSDRALAFLENERGGEDAREIYQNIVDYALDILNTRGSLIAYKGGRFAEQTRMTYGMPGVQVYRGTPPVSVGRSYVALRQGFEDMDHTQYSRDKIYLVRSGPSDQFLLDYTMDAYASFNPKINSFQTVGTDGTDFHHTDAVNRLLNDIQKDLTPLGPNGLRGIDLPIVMQEPDRSYDENLIVDLRRTKDIPLYNEILRHTLMEAQ